MSIWTALLATLGAPAEALEVQGLDKLLEQQSAKDPVLFEAAIRTMHACSKVLKQLGTRTGSTFVQDALDGLEVSAQDEAAKHGIDLNAAPSEAVSAAITAAHAA